MVRLSFNKASIQRYIITKQPAEIIVTSGNAIIKYTDETISNGSCIICSEKFCSKYSEDELTTSSFLSFPHNTSNRVCPTSAISFSINDGRAIISSEKCIGCGLCINRCPTAAISFDMESGKAVVTFDDSILSSVNEEEQKAFIASIEKVGRTVSSDEIKPVFFDKFEKALITMSKQISDLSEIVVRNTLINMGIPCNVNAAGNNHIRTEFFGEKDGQFIIGESDIVNNDTLAIPRRILDDMAVLIGRYNFDKEKVVALSVINGLPNKRTDYYEVVFDINNILGIQIHTVTYHILWLLNYLNARLDINDFRSFVVNKDSQNLLPAIEAHINAIRCIDGCCDGYNYRPEK